MFDRTLFSVYPYTINSGRDNAVSIASHYGLDDPLIQWRDFRAVQTGSKAHPVFRTDTRYLPGMKWPQHGVHHPSFSRAGLRDGWRYIVASLLYMHRHVMGRLFPLRIKIGCLALRKAPNSHQSKQSISFYMRRHQGYVSPNSDDNCKKNFTNIMKMYVRIIYVL